MKSILIVDDEDNIRLSLEGILEDEGFRTSFAATGEACLKIIQSEDPDLVLLDIWMPGIDGMETLKRIKQMRPQQLVIMMSGHGSIETAVKATRLGAYDFIEKPLSLEKVLLSIQNAMKIGQLVAENKALKEKIAHDYQMIGNSAAIDQLKQQIKLAAPSSGWVLINGENGTGKELVARAIHQQSNRADKPFIEINCAAIPEELIESELFGHEKGAFTGATAARRGKFDQANGGTLFLDEIGDMSLKTQAKILRILQEHKFDRVGGNRTIEVDVRVIAATNKNLQEQIRTGEFREDLFFRLNVLPFQVPPLRNRRDDIPLLCQHFLHFFCGKESRERKIISPEALKALANYDWPGNVRELKNLIERLVIMTPGKTIDIADLPLGINQNNGQHKQHDLDTFDMPSSYREAKEVFEKQFLENKLNENSWNISKTAEEIGLERSNLHRKIKQYQIEPN
ncbi:two component, sigma54 specific, transcriptional regulator, Fis family [Desulfuromusa kysingii]|uniref:Two component, sigma54 specific, transcriptional regulator, Fis family n=2 Tax=Desulfuromusa kysingii TaxID=37625 RepID=A0A1H4CB66_9BACT|nr:sigma-54 dependent transcriptional regulator [Desulfuromusa kysingii]SEA57661.1 two component, sigma54 specific, transcriptional regulator, Fis family [Desulfuromusa kysingii]